MLFPFPVCMNFPILDPGSNIIAMEQEDVPPLYNLTAPEMIRAIIAATDDPGAACRKLRTACKHLHALLPPRFPDPLAISLGDNSAAAPPPWHLLGRHPINNNWPVQFWQQMQHAAELQQDQHSARQQQQQQQHLAEQQLLKLMPPVHIQLGPDLEWVPGSPAARPVVPRCTLLLHPGFLQNVTDVTATVVMYSSELEYHMRMLHASSTSCGSSSSCLARQLLSSSSSALNRFILQPQGGPFWVSRPPAFTGSSCSDSSSSAAVLHPIKPFRSDPWRKNEHARALVSSVQLLDLMGAALIGRECLPLLLQLPQLKQLCIPVAAFPDAQGNYCELHPELTAAAAAAATRSAAGTAGSSGGSSSTCITAPLEVLQLLVIPAISSSSSSSTGRSSSSSSRNGVPFDVQTVLPQLLQPLAQRLLQLQQLEVAVLLPPPPDDSTAAAAAAVTPADLARQVAQQFQRSSSSSSSLKVVTVTFQRGDFPSLHTLHGSSATWDVSAGKVSAMRGCILQHRPSIRLQQITAERMQRQFCAIPAAFSAAAAAAAATFAAAAAQAAAGGGDPRNQQLLAILAEQQLAIQQGQANLGHNELLREAFGQEWMPLGQMESPQLQLQQLSLTMIAAPRFVPVLPSSCLAAVTKLQLSLPQNALPHLKWLLPDQQQRSAAAAGSSSGSNGSDSSICHRLRSLELYLEVGGSLSPAAIPQAPAQQQQQYLHQLLSECSSLQRLSVFGSKHGGIDLLPSLKGLAAAASSSLQEELQLVYTAVPPVAFGFGFIPYLSGFTALQRLCLSHVVGGREPLVLQLLPAGLLQLHLERFGLLLTRTVEQEQELLLERQQQHGRGGIDPIRQEALPGTIRARQRQRQYSEEAQQQLKEADGLTVTTTMPRLQQLVLINCYYAGFTGSCSLDELAAWAGPNLRELRIGGTVMTGRTGRAPQGVELRMPAAAASDMANYDQFAAWGMSAAAAASSSRAAAAALLPQLRSFTYFNSNIPVHPSAEVAEPDDAPVSEGYYGPVSDYYGSSGRSNSFQPGARTSELLAWLMRNAPELQQLRLAEAPEAPVFDKHVQQLLQMKLRYLEVFIGEDVRESCLETWMEADQKQQRQQQPGETNHQQEQQLTARLAALDAILLRTAQAVEHVHELQQLLASADAAAAAAAAAEAPTLGAAPGATGARPTVNPPSGRWLPPYIQRNQPLYEQLPPAVRRMMQELQHLSVAPGLLGMSAAAADRLRTEGAGGNMGAVKLSREWDKRYQTAEEYSVGDLHSGRTR